MKLNCFVIIVQIFIIFDAKIIIPSVLLAILNCIFIKIKSLICHLITKSYLKNTFFREAPCRVTDWSAVGLFGAM